MVFIKQITLTSDKWSMEQLIERFAPRLYSLGMQFYFKSVTILTDSIILELQESCDLVALKKAMQAHNLDQQMLQNSNVIMGMK